jgi:hypothetical protein
MDGSGSEQSPSKAQALSSIALPEAEGQVKTGASSSYPLPVSAHGPAPGSAVDDGIIDEEFAKVWQMGQQEEEQQENEQASMLVSLPEVEVEAEAFLSMPIPAPGPATDSAMVGGTIDEEFAKVWQMDQQEEEQASMLVSLPDIEAEASSLLVSPPGLAPASAPATDIVPFSQLNGEVWEQMEQEARQEALRQMEEQEEEQEEELQLALQAVQAPSPRAEHGASFHLPYTPCLVPVSASFDDTTVEEELALQQWDRDEKERERRQAEQEEQNQQNQRDQEHLEQHQQIQGFFEDALYGMEYDTPLPPAAPARMQHVQNQPTPTQPTPTQPTPTQSLPAQYGFTLSTNTPAAYYHPGQNTQAQIAPSYNPPTGQAVSVTGRAAALVPASTKLATTSKQSLKKQEARHRLRKTPESERRDRDIPCKKCATAMAKNDLARGCIDEVRGGRIACTVKKGEASDARCLECTYEARTCEPVSCCFPFVPSSLQMEVSSRINC